MGRFGTGIALAALLAACGSTTQTATAGHTSSRVSTPAASHSAVANPFAIVARYSASSLGLKNPRDLAIGPNGNVYVIDASDRVSEVSPAGKVLARWGGRGNTFCSASTASPTGAFMGQVGSGAGSTDPDLSGWFHLQSIDRHDSAGDAFVQGCPGPASVAEPSSPPVQYALVFDHAHNLIGAWDQAPFLRSPAFGPNGEVFAVGFRRPSQDCFRCTTNTILKLKVSLYR